MNQFRTVFNIEPSVNKIAYGSKILMLGSCFSDNIGVKLKRLKHTVLSNPYGVLYNPYSIQEVLSHILGHRQFDENDLTCSEDLWHSYLHHTAFSDQSKNVLINKITKTQKQVFDFLRQADFLFITFGTAWVYQHKKTMRIVANCHKNPNREFKRFRLSVCDITDEFANIIKLLKTLNPDIKIIFTISPVRHLKDGVIENQISKSTLTLSVHEIIAMLDDCCYFPSYEIMMDDLRDYRFYSNNMTHPSALAVEYIFSKFAETFFSAKTQKIQAEIEKVLKAIEHRPLNANTSAYQNFIKKTLNRIGQLDQQIASVSWEEETKLLKKRLDSPDL